MQPAPAEPPAREGVVVQRIRVGALGLAGVFLLVMLATALLRAASDPTLANQTAHPTVNAAEPAEPLAQLGVAPGNAPPDAEPAPARAPRPARPAR